MGQITNKMKTKICIEFTLAIFALIFVSRAAGAADDPTTTILTTTTIGGPTTTTIGGPTGGPTGGPSGLTSPRASGSGSGSGSEGLSSTPDFIYVLMSAAAAFILRQI